MPLTLKLTNFDEGSILDQTQLTDDAPVGANNLSVDNTNDFTLTSFLLLGGIGSKDAELLQSIGKRERQVNIRHGVRVITAIEEISSAISLPARH